MNKQEKMVNRCPIHWQWFHWVELDENGKCWLCEHNKQRRSC
jgi:hypothetical protein